MIVACDAKAVEWYAGTFLAGCPVARNELINNYDIHSENVKAFHLPSRLIAKTFLFRLIYGGTSYSYPRDPDFMEVSTSEKFWQKVIDRFHEKYTGWDKWWISLMQEASTTGRIVNPYTGRTYDYSKVRGEWPETTIKNYIVQGLAADIVAVARVSFARRFHAAGIEGVIINTVHDSIIVDVPSYEVDRVVRIFHEVFRDLPANLERVFKKPFDLPLRCEVEAGMNMGETEEVKFSLT